MKVHRSKGVIEAMRSTELHDKFHWDLYEQAKFLVLIALTVFIMISLER